MPYFVFKARDRAEKGSVRTEIRGQHRAYIRIDRPGCRCVAGGPLMSSDGLHMTGTLLIFEASDQEAVEQFMRDDPYSRANLFAETSIDMWNWSLGRAAP